jgi:endonuclease/exonuclease/phosphatase (EEP) superfamily protein YafD
MRWLDGLLVFCAALVAVVSVLPLGARLSWLLELTTHFRLQYLVVTVVLLGLLALRRRWGVCVALVAVGAVSAVPVLPYVPRALPPPNAATAPVKILTVNVSFRPFSPRQFLEIVREANPDVLLVQELTPHTESVLRELDTALPHYRKFTADGPSGIGLWSRHELESATTFALGRLPAIEARVRGPSGTFSVIGVHLSAPTSLRRAAARNRELIELAARSAAVVGPLIVAGDFNTTPYSPYFVEMLAASGLKDARRGRTLSASWPTMLPWAGIPIDHVAVNTGFDIVSHRRLPNFESDHYGLLVEVALRAERTAEQR